MKEKHSKFERIAYKIILYIVTLLLLLCGLGAFYMVLTNGDKLLFIIYGIMLIFAAIETYYKAKDVK